MILSAAATVLVASLAMVPGWLLIRGQAQGVGMTSGALAASLTVMMLTTALAGITIHILTGHSISVLWMVPISLLASLIVFRSRSPGPAEPAPFEWQGVAIGMVFLLYGLFVQYIAVKPQPDGALALHGWFNADWFKHLGHVAALGNFGIPATDNFNQGDTLHYYWLSYILPGAGLQVGNNGWSALATANSIFVFLFGSVFYGVLRKSGASKRVGLLIGIVALFASAPISFIYQLAFGIGLDGFLSAPSAPKGPALMTLSQYIPQHLLVIVLLLSWFLLKDHRQTRLLALAALASVMTISILLGAVCLVAYGLYRLWTGQLRAIPELAAMAVISALLVLVLQVLQIGNFGSAIESPLLDNDVLDLPLHTRIFMSIDLVIGNVGLPLLIAVLGLYYWRPTDPKAKEAKVFSAALMLAVLFAAIAVEVVMTERLAIETRIRAVNLLGIANALVGAWVFATLWAAGNRKRAIAAIGLAVIIIVALPSAILRTAWHGRIGDSYTTVIPADDRKALAHMRSQTDTRSIVLQFPEAPVLAREAGDDAWAAIIGQRAVTANLRATDYPSAEPRIVAAERFFDGQSQPIADEVDIVYLSRALHPETYDLLIERMRGEPAFEQTACYSDACLFERLDTSAP